ncbi:MAG: hypothetical protein PHG71_01205, partial [Kiritimatiellae bacterium]|nr:hypothetical protein [Kiritimatiellia bacterium]
LSNLWGCCRLDATIRRDGTRAETWEIPGFPLWSAEAETSLASLPGADGACPVTELLRDSSGRVTNRVLAVWKNGQPDPAFAPLSSATEYPYGTDGHIVTTDPRGVSAVTRTWQAGGAEVTETDSAGVTNRVTRYFGGAVMAEKYWDGRWTRETRSSGLDTAGCRVETVIAESSDYSAFTNSITVYDFLGRAVSVTTPLGITSNFYSGASDRLVRVSRTGQPDTLFVYDELGNVTATAMDVDGDGQVSYSGPDRISATDTRYEEDASNVWWRVTSQSESVGIVTHSAAVVKEQVTGLSPALLSRTVTVSPDGTSTTLARAFENGTDIIVETSQTGTAAPYVRRAL